MRALCELLRVQHVHLSPKVASNVNGGSWTSARSQQPTEIAEDGEGFDYDPPIMDDLATTDIEDMKVAHPNQAGGALVGFVSELLHGKEKKQDLATQRKQRLQLTIDDLSAWAPGPLLDGQSTPKESISSRQLLHVALVSQLTLARFTIVDDAFANGSVRYLPPPFFFLERRGSHLLHTAGRHRHGVCFDTAPSEVCGLYGTYESRKIINSI